MKFIFAASLVVSLNMVAQDKPAYKHKNASIETRVNDLLKRMTLNEKLHQISQFTIGRNDNPNNVQDELNHFNGLTGSIIYFGHDPVMRNQLQKKAVDSTRLGIPILFGFDVIHGYRTLYPISLGSACSWNPDLYRAACAQAARETYLSGINWTFSPMIDVARDPRWGRIAEGYGEDPYTTGIFAAAAVKGYQGGKLSNAPNTIAADLKHFVAYGMSEGGRDYVYSEVSRQSLWDTYLPPYIAGINAGAMTIMSSYNDISGTPASANKYTLTDILKDKWGFQGFVVSDWAAITQLIPQGVAKDDADAARKALMAGIDMDMITNTYISYGKNLLEKKQITQARIDDAVRRVLRVKFIMGLFENPYTPVVDEKDRYLQPEAKKIATQLAEESIVLLKNKDNVLPLDKNVKHIALIGPLVKDSVEMMGNWNGRGEGKDVKSIYTAIRQAFGQQAAIAYARGCEYDGADTSHFAEARDVAAQSDVVLMFVGEKWWWSGENGSRASINLPAIQEQLIKDIHKEGKKIILVLFNGRSLALTNVEPYVDAIVEAWQPGTFGGEAISHILTGEVNPSGKLDVSFPVSGGQIPIYYSKRTSARPTGRYQDISSEPLYPFGYGLSYTTFKYGVLQVSKQKMNRQEKLVASIDVSNTGNRDGLETVHWFISDPVATISRPRKELKYFEKKEIKQGQTVTFQFIIDPMRDLSYPDENGKRHLEAGDFYLQVGTQQVKFELLEGEY